MNKSEAINYIEDFTWGKTKLGLERTRALLEGLGNPQDKLRFVHVAGSNGKGSTCAMLSSVLTKAGYKTGFYSSPYLVDFCERICIDGKKISGERLAEVTDKVRVVADALPEHPTQFELITAIGFQYFLEEGVDIVVLEVGMGGEFDATNVISSPEVAVICNIGLEHTEYLGDTIEEIALTKAGIIKSGSDVVCYDGWKEATKVVENVSNNRGATFNRIDFEKINVLSESLEGSTFAFNNKTYEIRLIGRHQIYNAAVAISAIECLRRRGFDISDKALFDGLKKASWKGRFEVLEKEPLLILDGGHNPQCAAALTHTLDVILPDKKFVFIAGILADKNYKKVIDIIAPYAARFVCVTPDNPRALKAEELAEYLRGQGFSAEAINCADAAGDKDVIGEAISQAKNSLEGADGIIAFGSLYLAGMILKKYET